MDFVKFFDRKFLSDIVVKNGDKEFNCHKVILARFTFFETLFSGKWSDSNSSVIKFDHNFVDLELSLKYIYGFEIDDENLLHIIEDLKFFGIEIPISKISHIILNGHSCDSFLQETKEFIMSSEFDDVLFNVISHTKKFIFLDDERLMRFTEKYGSLFDSNKFYFRKSLKTNNEFDNSSKMEYYFLTHPIIHMTELSGNNFVKIDFIRTYIESNDYSLKNLKKIYNESDFEKNYGHLISDKTKIVFQWRLTKDFDVLHPVEYFSWKKSSYKVMRRRIRREILPSIKLSSLKYVK